MLRSRKDHLGTGGRGGFVLQKDILVIYNKCIDTKCEAKVVNLIVCATHPTPN